MIVRLAYRECKSILLETREPFKTWCQWNQLSVLTMCQSLQTSRRVFMSPESLHKFTNQLISTSFAGSVPRVGCCSLGAQSGDL